MAITTCQLVLVLQIYNPGVFPLRNILGSSPERGPCQKPEMCEACGGQWEECAIYQLLDHV